MWKTWKTVALAAGLSLLLAACAGGGGGGGVATLGDEAAGAATASPSVDPEDALAEFAECMRENGIEDFPDPGISEDGGITIVGPGSGGEEPVAGAPTEVDQEEMDAAMAACQELLPEGSGPGAGMSQEDQAALQDAMLEYAQCMRDHGIDMPDPEFSSDGGAFTIEHGGDGLDPNDPDFQAADEQCRSVLEDVLPERAPGGDVDVES